MSILNPDMESMSSDERKALQSERLQATVKYEYANVPFYRERMDKHGVKPEDIRGIDDLNKLPFTDKNDLRDGFPFGLLAVPQQQIVRIQGSSGTSGHPIVTGYTENDIEVWTEMAARALAALGANSDSIVQVAYGYGLFTGGLGLHQAATRLGAMVIPMSGGNTQRQLMMMEELGTTILCCTPSYAIYLGEAARDMGILSQLKLKSGCFGGEPWTEKMRTELESLFGIDAMDIYGLSEIAGPGVSFECKMKDGLHINEDHIIAEVINPETGEILPYGESGELVMTTITKTGQPMIRYRTRDICMLNKEPCSCGRTTLRMSRLAGRTDDMLVIRGINVYPGQIESVLETVSGITPHYLIVADREASTDSLEVQIELTEDMFSDTISQIESLKNLIALQIKSVVGLQAEVKLVPPRSLPRSEGKSRRVIDKRRI
ncbi:MAG: phenylacetate--CoA ligase [Dehalococcoidales bacterium]